jgi:hypothetical protein
MGVVTNIIDALRRIGSATQKTALERQGTQLVGKEVLERIAASQDAANLCLSPIFRCRPRHVTREA